MPPSLRKACQACTKSKRRCIPQLPACERCAKKHIPCIYDLEPVVQSQPPPQYQDNDQSNGSTPQSIGGGQLNIVYSDVETAREASIAALASGEGMGSAAARPMLMTDGDSAHWLIAFFTQVARDGLDGKSSPFIHACSFRQPFPAADSREESAMTCKANKERWHLQRRLEEVHNLTTQALDRLLLEKPSSKKDLEVERLVVDMFSATHSLWTSAPKQLDDTFDPWEAWIVGESIRRSMFAGIMVRGIWHVAAYGHVYYEPFYESLPFDPRADLWEATSAEEWEEAIRKYGGQHTKLKSYHEFITTTGTKLNPEEDGAFQRMLFVCYHGSNGIRTIEELDERPKR